MTNYDPRDPGWQRQRDLADIAEWTRVSAEMTDLVSTAALRPDLIAVVEPGVGRGAPAVYIPEMAHVEVDPRVCADGEDPADIRLGTTAGRLRHAPLVGAGRHEAAHGHLLHGTAWTIDQDPARRPVVEAALLLEESRIEKHAVAADPAARVFLRASFSSIVSTGTDTSTIVGAAYAAGLVAARADAGILDPAEAADVAAAAADRLGTGNYARLRDLWLAAQALDAPTADQMEDLGRRWIDVLRDAGASDAELGGTGPLVMVCSHGRDGSAGPTGTGTGTTVAAAAAAVAAAAAAEAAADAETAANTAAAAAAAAEGAEATAEATAAVEVFNGGILVGHGPGGGREGLSGEREPSGSETAAATVLAARLRRAQYRDYSTTVRAVRVPPGRLRGARAMRRDAQIAAGIPPTAMPWDRVRRGYVERPPVRVGIGCDISGSMAPVVAEVASVGWSVAHAVHRADGDVAAVAYGRDVHPFVMPGEAPRRVRTFDANGGSENWTAAIRALSGALRMRDADGVRLLVFVSDGHYKGRQKADGEVLLRRLTASGAKVLWIGFRGRGAGWDHDDVPEWIDYVRVERMDDIGPLVGGRMVELLERA